MRCHSSLLAITLAVVLMTPAAFGQNAKPGASPIDVLYIVTANTIQTYNVDPTYGSATLYGTLSTPMSTPDYPLVVPGANDHFIYVLCTSTAYWVRGVRIFVYGTDSNGVPQDPPVQTLDFPNGLGTFMIDPAGTLAYAVETVKNFSQQSEFGISAFAINPDTGVLTQFSNFSATSYPPTSGLCNPFNPFADPGYGLVGFNSSGTQLIDSWYCDGHGDSADYNYTRTLNQQTGALGPDVLTVSGGSSEDEFTSVAFTPVSILAFSNYGYSDSPNELDVYWPNSTLDFSCTYTMLDACSYSGGVGADRTGNFLFFYTYTGAIEITRLDMTNKTIEPVGIPLSGGIEAFSLDDLLIYGSGTYSWNGQLVMPVYVFDPATGLVTDNDQTIPLLGQYPYPNVVPALWQ